MPDRTVTIRLRLDNGTLRASLAASERDVDRATNHMGRSFDQTNSRLRTVSHGLTLIGGAAALGVGVAVKEFADFDAQMAQVKSLTHATQGEMQQLRHAALTVGQAFGISATQAADAEIELVKAGISLTDIIHGGLKGALTIAAAGQTDVAEATEIATVAMTQFGLKGEQIPHVADLLAAGADKALGSVGDLGYGLKQAGTTAHQMGLSIEDVIGTLAEFANAGLIGERGGTTFKQFLLQLAAPTDKAKELMHKYGLEIYKANGQLKSMPEIAGNLQRAFEDLTPAQRNSALAIIFGTRAVQAANILMKDGAKVNREWIESVNDQGFAAEQAAGKMDSLKGDVTKLGSALKNDFITTGEGANETLRGLVQHVTDLVVAYGRLSPEQQKTVLETAALVAGLGLGGAAFLRMIVAVNEAREAITALTASSALARTTLVGLGRALGVVTVAAATAGLEQYIGRADIAKVGTDDLTKSLAHFAETGRLGGAGIDLFTRRLQIAGDKVDTTGEAMERFSVLAEDAFGQGLGDRIDRLIDMGHSMSELKSIAEQLDPALAKLAKEDPSEAGYAFAKFAGVLREQGATQREINDLFPKYVQAADEASQTARANAAAHEIVQRALNGEKVSAEELNAALEELSNGALGTEQANLAFRDSVHSARDALKENGATLSENTVKGRANRLALANAAEAALHLSEAVKDQTGSQDKANEVLAASRERLVNVAAKFLGSRKAAERYVTTVLGIPPVARTDVRVNADAARRDVQHYLGLLDSIPASKYTTLYTKLARIDTGRAGGGPVYGPGTSTSDSIPVRVSNGEYVTRAWAVERVGLGVMDYINRHGALPTSAYRHGGYVAAPRYAGGGQVGPISVTPNTTVTVLLDGKLVDQRMVRVIREDHRETVRRFGAGVGAQP